MANEKVVIVGGGIAGSCTGVYLRRLGFEFFDDPVFQVLEQVEPRGAERSRTRSPRTMNLWVAWSTTAARATCGSGGPPR